MYRIKYHHTLAYIYCELLFDIQRHIIMATQINTKNENNAEAAGREKVTQTQLNSERRAELADLQGVNQSLYSEIDPLHLPEALSLVGQHRGQGELYVALKSSIAGVISTVKRKECLQQQNCISQDKR